MDRNRLPELPLTVEEYNRIPRAEDHQEGFVNYAPIGTTFKCIGSKTIENTVIGVIVKGNDALASQAGAALFSLPERFINRYRPVIKGSLLQQVHQI